MQLEHSTFSHLKYKRVKRHRTTNGISLYPYYLVSRQPYPYIHSFTKSQDTKYIGRISGVSKENKMFFSLPKKFGLFERNQTFWAGGWKKTWRKNVEKSPSLVRLFHSNPISMRGEFGWVAKTCLLMKLDQVRKDVKSDRT